MDCSDEEPLGGGEGDRPAWVVPPFQSKLCRNADELTRSVPLTPSPLRYVGRIGKIIILPGTVRLSEAQSADVLLINLAPAGLVLIPTQGHGNDSRLANLWGADSHSGKMTDAKTERKLGGM